MTGSQKINLTQKEEKSFLKTLDSGALGLAVILKRVTVPGVADVVKHAGYDAVYIDLEYGAIKESEVAPIARRSTEIGLTSLVRIPSADPACCERVLAYGVDGIVVPKVSSVADVEAIVDVCNRIRGAHPPRPVALVIMLESPQALALADDLASIEGVDVLHIGTSDLSESLGINGQLSDPRIEDAYRRVISVCRTNGKVAGGGGLGPDQAMTKKVISMGVRFITAGNEWSFMQSAATKRASDLRKIDLSGNEA